MPVKATKTKKSTSKTSSTGKVNMVFSKEQEAILYRNIGKLKKDLSNASLRISNLEDMVTELISRKTTLQKLSSLFFRG